MTSILLLSGGMDSAAVGLLLRPEVGLFVDYGQPSAAIERLAAQRVQWQLGIEWAELKIDCSGIGAESIVDPVRPLVVGSSWWPYRNQLIVTFAAAFAIRRGANEVVIGTVSSDGGQHRDGTSWFIDSIDQLIGGQEGGIRLKAPAIDLTTEELCTKAQASRSFLAGTYSCHVGNLPCGSCGGCRKRAEVMENLFATSGLDRTPSA